MIYKNSARAAQKYQKSQIWRGKKISNETTFRFRGIFHDTNGKQTKFGLPSRLFIQVDEDLGQKIYAVDTDNAQSLIDKLTPPSGRSPYVDVFPFTLEGLQACIDLGVEVIEYPESSLNNERNAEMIISNVTITDNKIIFDLAPDKNKIDVPDTYKTERLSDLKPKDEFKIGDDVFIVLEQTGNGTKVISKEFAYRDVAFGDNSDWKVSHIRKTLNNEYFKNIAAIIGEKNILSMDRDLTSLDGLDDYGTCTDKVSLLTTAEYAKYHKILGLKSNYPDWWWLITAASTPSNDSSRSVSFVHSDGLLSWLSCRWTNGVRPVLMLNSSLENAN